MKSSAYATLIGLCIIVSPTRGEDLTCLSADDAAAGSLYAQLQREAYAALDRRAERFEQRLTADKIRAHQQELRQFFIEQLGGFPDRVPLEATTVRTIEAEHYSVECVIFSSRPNHHITANLYLPKSSRSVPGVVVSSGHSRTGKTADYNQRFGIMMAEQGMAALCFDPIGQGERSQVLGDDDQPHLGTTTEHFLIGVGSTLVGRSTAGYRVWDAMRAIDYLCSRKEVNPRKIGFTGCSGGGTLTSYVMALDDRVVCAAPACYLTTFRRLIETIGPQDAEQNVYGQLDYGLDHPDYVLMRAPKPTLISATTSDFFDIQGSWNNFRQAKRVYGVLGYPERVDLVEVAGKHGVQPQNLATIAHWMKRWLLARDEPVAIAELPTRQPDELLCTDTGQVLTSLANEKSVFALNVQYEAELAKERKQRWNKKPRQELEDEVRRLLSVESNANQPPVTHADVGRVDREDYHIDKIVLRRGSGVPLPGLTFHPESPKDDAYLYLHDDGKAGDSDPGGEVEKLVANGYVVVTIDLSGQGETATGKRDELLTDWKTYYLAYLLGKPLVGIRTRDALSAGEFIANYERKAGHPRKVHLIGVGQAGIVAMHAAALAPKRFATLTLRETPQNWSDLLGQNMPSGQLESVVHGALQVYDLPDLPTLIGQDKVTRIPR